MTTQLLHNKMEVSIETGAITMEKTSIAAALKALATDSLSRSKIGRMRELLSDIEAAQNAGVSNAKIVETLNAQNFEITLKVFETMLYRLRKEQGKTRKSNQEVKIEKKPEATTTPQKIENENLNTETNDSTLQGTGIENPIFKKSDKGIFGGLKPSRDDGMVDLIQTKKET